MVSDKFLETFFEPVCIFENSLNVKLVNGAWLQSIGSGVESLKEELAQDQIEKISNACQLVTKKVSSFVEDSILFNSLNCKTDIRICKHDSDFMLVVNNSELDKENLLYDNLTKIPTRKILKDRIEQYIALSKRENTKTVLFFIDLDNFKPVNDTYGHEAGDFVLKESVARIHEAIRDTDTIARWGGDEFIVAAPGFKESVHAALLGKRILRCLTKPFEYKEDMLKVGGSIGIGVFPDNADNVEDLIKAADKAMYKAKNNGKDMYCFL